MTILQLTIKKNAVEHMARGFQNYCNHLMLVKKQKVIEHVFSKIQK